MITSNLDRIKSKIRTIPDFPIKGILFRDITPVLGDSDLLSHLIQIIVHYSNEFNFEVVSAIDARGFILGGIIAHQLGVGFVPIRKSGKLPFKVFRASYELEYGNNTLEVHADAFLKYKRVLLIDDLLATGGTAKVAIKLIQQAGGEVVSAVFFIELVDLFGRRDLKKLCNEVFSVVQY